MISELLCDTEDWRNDSGNSALRNRNKLHFEVYSNRKHHFKLYFFFHNITVFRVFFDQINVALVNTRDQ